MVNIKKLEKGNELLNKLGQSCRVEWVQFPNKKRTRGGEIGVIYPNGDRGIGYPEAFYPMPYIIDAALATAGKQDSPSAETLMPQGQHNEESGNG